MTTTLDRQNSDKYKPKFLSQPQPDKYRYVCAHCSKRYGKPDKNGWIDVVRCKDCPKLLYS